MKHLLTSLLAACLFLALTACAPSGQTLEVTIKAKDIAFDVTAFTVKKGQMVNVTYTNEGVLEHNFLIDEFKVEEKILPGETTTFSFTPTSEGTFKYYCNVPGHTEAGMVGTLTVTP